VQQIFQIFQSEKKIKKKMTKHKKSFFLQKKKYISFDF